MQAFTLLGAVTVTVTAIALVISVRAMRRYSNGQRWLAVLGVFAVAFLFVLSALYQFVPLSSPTALWLRTVSRITRNFDALVLATFIVYLGAWHDVAGNRRSGRDPGGGVRGSVGTAESDEGNRGTVGRERSAAA